VVARLLPLLGGHDPLGRAAAGDGDAGEVEDGGAGEEVADVLGEGGLEVLDAAPGDVEGGQGNGGRELGLLGGAGHRWISFRV